MLLEKVEEALPVVICKGSYPCGKWHWVDANKATDVDELRQSLMDTRGGCRKNEWAVREKAWREWARNAMEKNSGLAHKWVKEPWAISRGGPHYAREELYSYDACCTRPSAIENFQWTYDFVETYDSKLKVADSFCDANVLYKYQCKSWTIL